MNSTKLRCESTLGCFEVKVRLKGGREGEREGGKGGREGRKRREGGREGREGGSE